MAAISTAEDEIEPMQIRASDLSAELAAQRRPLF
jgi:hypothetical protein